MTRKLIGLVSGNSIYTQSLMSNLDSLGREDFGIVVPQKIQEKKPKKIDKTRAARQSKDRAKKEAVGLVNVSTYIDKQSKAKLEWILKMKPHLTRAEFIERLIKREFNKLSKPIYDAISRAQNEKGYNKVTEETGFDHEFLEELNALNTKKNQKNNRNYKASFHPTAQPTRKVKEPITEEVAKSSVNELFDELQF